ncbi:LysR family transcriptional regulator [Microbispora sp. RL4-1S]|uniref:LysR family transcriptional regulator n=1 Tax=Microbispora oryzae TaxID=2806554 RepID=A0A941AIS1_9ACTN|nr:LysR family transcriptional regulator [Microbispora oryzae]MBP2705520.1 LysR family transcriptional regulator [Microbispora oryzae]
MNLAQCAAFVAVVDTGSFTKAADARQISQSAVSHAIASLESELGVPLMKRDRSGVELTAIGRRLLVHARSVIRHAELMRMEAEKVGGDHLTGSLRIACTGTFDPHLLARALSRFGARFPGFDSSLREGDDRQISNWLHRQEIEVGIFTGPERHLASTPLLEEEIRLVLPAGHPLAAGPVVRVAQITDESFVVLAGSDPDILRLALPDREHGPTIAYRTHCRSTLFALVGEGLGLALLPETTLRSVPPDLRVLPLSPPVTRRLSVCLSSAARTSPAARSFVSIMQGLAGEIRAAAPHRLLRTVEPESSAAT